MKYMWRTIAAGIVAAVVVAGSEVALAAGECPEGYRKLTVVDVGTFTYMGDPCVPVQKFKGSPPRRMTVVEGGMNALFFEQYTGGTEGPLNEQVETIEVGGRTYRVGIDTP